MLLNQDNGCLTQDNDVAEIRIMAVSNSGQRCCGIRMMASNSGQLNFKNVNHPTRGNFVVVMAGS